MTLQLTPWQNPPAQPELTAEDVHLWRFPLDCQDSLDPLLNEEELQRAKRLVSGVMSGGERCQA